MEDALPRAFAAQIWLLRGIIHSLPGVLSWQGEKLELVLHNSGTLGWKGLVRLEEKLNVPDLSLHLPLDKPVCLFACTPAEIQRFSLPWYFFGGGMHLWVNGKKYRLSLLPPNNTRMPNRSLGRQVETARSIGRARKIGRQWKTILELARRQSS